MKRRNTSLKTFLNEEQKISLEAEDHAPKYNRKEAMQRIADYNTLGEYIYKTERVGKAIDKKFDEIIESASQVLNEETDDWFDSVTIKRNVKELSKYNEEFKKVSGEINQLEQRRTALYEDMGMILNRYFKLKELQNK